MGWTWEVLAWANLGDGYRDYPQYQGNSLIAALRAAWSAKRNGIGCITVKWRG